MRAATRFLRRYSVSLVALALATLWTLLFWPVNERFSFAVFIAAVMVSIWYDGPRRGLATTGLASLILGLVQWFQTPDHTLETDLEFYLRLGMFGLVGVLACQLCKQCRRAVRAVDHVQDILSSTGVALIFADADGQVVSLNPKAEALTGWSQADGFRTPLEHVLRLVHENTHQPAVNLAADVLQKETAHELAPDLVLVAAHGRRIPVEGEAVPVRGADGRCTGIALTFRDVSQRRDAEKELRLREEQWRTLAAALPAGVLMLDGIGRCVFANAAALAACGCGLEESLGEGWTRFLLPQDRDRVVSDWLAAVKAKQKYSGEFRLQTPRGSLRWLQLYAAPVLSDDGEVIGHVGTLEDVTERKQAEEALRRAQEEFAGRIEERIAAQQSAEEALRQAQAEFARRLDEAAARQRQTEEALRQAREDHSRQLDQRAAGHKQIEEELSKTRAELNRQLQEQTALRTRAEAELQTTRQDFERHLQEAGVGQRRAEEALQKAQAGFETRLREVESGRQQTEDGLRRALAELQDELAVRTRELATRTSGHGEALEALQQRHEEAQKRLQERTQAHGQAEEALRQLRDTFQKQLEERIASHHQAVESLRQERDALARRLEERTDAHAQTEEAARQQRVDLLKQLDERATAHRQVEEALQQERQAFLRQIDGLTAGHQEAHAELARHREAAHGLRQSREQLQALLDSMPALVSLKDAAGRYLFVNRPFAAVLRRDVEEIVGKTPGELLPPDTAAFVEASDRQVLQARVAAEVEEVYPNGREPHTYLTGKFPVGDVVGSVSVDITGRRRTEGRIPPEREALQYNTEQISIPEQLEVNTNGAHQEADARAMLAAATDTDWLSYN